MVGTMSFLDGSVILDSLICLSILFYSFIFV